jgi:hypothetical protein
LIFIEKSPEKKKEQSLFESGPECLCSFGWRQPVAVRWINAAKPAADAALLHDEVTEVACVNTWSPVSLFAFSKTPSRIK